MSAHLLDREGTSHPRAERTSVEAKLSSGEFFWLDLHGPGEEDLALLRDTFGFHPLAVEDSEHFGQRAKVEDYGEFVFLVLYGAAPEPDEDRLVEVHCFYSERFLVTVRRDESPACDAVRERYARRPARPLRPIVLLYRLFDALVDSFFPALEDVDHALETIEDELLVAQGDARLQQIVKLRRRLVLLRRAAAPQRDLAGQVAGGILELPDLDDDARRYFRDVHDHLIRVTEQLDVYRDLLTGVLDVHQTTVSNRQNAVMKQLTVIATIFLPLTFITGFFGQNFDWMVGHVGGWPQFVAFGLGLELLTVAALLILFKKRGWF
ncbi:MAG: magnesium/cobalt transporter CorA [Gaiellaceae bacterium]